MITYEFAKRDLQDNGGNPKFPVVVLLDKRVVGKIDIVEGGYQYRTKNNDRGEIFPTFRACQNSLEVSQ